MKKLLLILAIIASSYAPAEAQDISAKKIALTSIPKNIKYRGKATDARQWSDKLGDNLLLLSSLEYFENATATEMEGQSIELFAYHYIKADTGYRLLWRLNDFQKRCDLDIVAQFINGALTVTDLDKDGIAETTVQYKVSCRGDVSPSYMKLIMHEDSVKYALRGNMWVRVAETDKFSVTEKDVNLEKLSKKKDEYEQWIQSTGRYENEKDFTKAPPSFLIYARRQWLKFAKESFD